MEQKRVATEWDGCWFCDKCYSMHHWKEKAFVENGEKLCKDCYEKKLKKQRFFLIFFLKTLDRKRFM